MGSGQWKQSRAQSTAGSRLSLHRGVARRGVILIGRPGWLARFVGRTADPDRLCDMICIELSGGEIDRIDRLGCGSGLVRAYPVISAAAIALWDDVRL